MRYFWLETWIFSQIPIIPKLLSRTWPKMLYRLFQKYLSSQSRYAFISCSFSKAICTQLIWTVIRSRSGKRMCWNCLSLVFSGDKYELRPHNCFGLLALVFSEESSCLMLNAVKIRKCHYTPPMLMHSIHEVIISSLTSFPALPSCDTSRFSIKDPFVSLRAKTCVKPPILAIVRSIHRCIADILSNRTLASTNAGWHRTIASPRKSQESLIFVPYKYGCRIVLINRFISPQNMCECVYCIRWTGNVFLGKSEV